MKTENDMLRFPVLIGDIGGTNARFAILAGRDAPLQSFDPVETGSFPDIQSAIKAAVGSQSDISPCSAVIALAAPIDGDAVDLTNAHWVVKPRDVMSALGIDDVVLLNDFEAQALALAVLCDSDLQRIGRGTNAPDNARVVIGPGTGLGTAGLIRAGGLWIPVPGEGGHISLGPDAPDEFRLWPYIESELGRISAEILLAGRGLVRLHGAMCRLERRQPALPTPAAVTGAALAGNDEVAVRTVELYCRLLGRVAGDIALIFMATGGAYIGGGIAPLLLPFLQRGGFRDAFESKTPHEDLMATIGTSVITAERPALSGISAFARSPGDFGVSLSGRRWRADLSAGRKSGGR